MVELLVSIEGSFEVGEHEFRVVWRGMLKREIASNLYLKLSVIEDSPSHRVDLGRKYNSSRERGLVRTQEQLKISKGSKKAEGKWREESITEAKEKIFEKKKMAKNANGQKKKKKGRELLSWQIVLI